MALTHLQPGAIDMFRELPHEFISVADMPEVLKSGDRHMLYGLEIVRTFAV